MHLPPAVSFAFKEQLGSEMEAFALASLESLQPVLQALGFASWPALQ